MQHSPAKTKKFMYGLVFLAIIITAVNSLGVIQAAAATSDQTSNNATSTQITSDSSNQSSLQSVNNPMTSNTNSNTKPQMRPSPTVTEENYIFQPEPNGAITVLNVSSGAVAYTASDLAYLLNLMPSNAKVTLKAGNYAMRSQYTPKDGQHIIGESRSGVNIVGYKTKTDYALISGTVSNLELANFTFNVNNPNPSATQTHDCGIGIVLVGSNNTLHGITLYNAYLQGIVIGFYGSNVRSDGNLVEDCEVYGCGNDGIVLDSCTNSQIKNCYIHDSYGPVAGGANIAYGSSNCIVEGCSTNNTAYGFATDNSLGTPEDSITFLHNISNASYINGFMVDGGSNVVFEGNTASGYTQYGFVSYANPISGFTPSYTSYSDNVATDANSVCGVGYCLTQGRDFTFSDNQATDNLLGLEVESMTGKATIDSCTFSDNTAHDVMVVNNPAYTSISNCKMGSSAPLWVDSDSGPYTTIQNCV